MHLYGATMVRNEADVVEAFVRHNLAMLDRMYVIDHGSIDGTSEILAALVAEGLPLVVKRDDSPGFAQSDIVTGLVREIFETTPAHFVFAIDADEFLKIPSRPLLERVLGQVPPGMHALMRWQTYVPDFRSAARGLSLRQLLASSNRLEQERHGLNKIVVARCFSTTPDALIENGNHVVWPSRWHRESKSTNPHAAIRPDVAALAHVPVRSVEQFTAKVAVGRLALLATPSIDPAVGFHWQEVYDDIARGVALSPALLESIACNYSIAKERWQPSNQIARVSEPFLADFELRYASLGHQEPLALVLRMAEGMIRGR